MNYVYRMSGCCTAEHFWSTSSAVTKGQFLAFAVEVPIASPKISVSHRAFTGSKDEPVLALASSHSLVSVPRSESVTQHMEISLRNLRLSPTEDEGGDLQGHDEQSVTSGDDTPNVCNGSTTMPLPALRRLKNWKAVRRRKRMPFQPPWTPDDFEQNAKRILDSILSEPGEGQGVWEVLNSWLGKITRVELGKLIKYLGFRSRPRLALDVFCWMSNQRGRLKPTPHVYSSIIGMLGRAGMVDEAQEIFDERQLQNLDSIHIYNAMIGAYVKCGNFPRAWTFYEDICKRGLKADEVTFNTLLKGITRNDVALTMVETLLAQMRLVGIAPSRYTYNTVLTVLSKFGYLERASAILEEMRSVNETPDLCTFNTIINMYKRAGQYDEALQAFNMLLDAGFSPDAITYTYLMQLLSQVDGVEAALDKFSAMRKTGCRPDVVAYSLVIHIYGKAGHTEKAEKILQEMRDAGVQPNTVTWSSLIQAYGKKGMIEKVDSCFTEMQRSGCRPDASLLNIMMIAYAQADLPHHAAILFRRMRSAGVKPDAACFNTIIHASANSGQRQNAEALHNEMIEAGFAPDKLSRRCLRNLSRSGRGK